MFTHINNVFNLKKYSTGLNKPTKILIVTDSIFFSAIALVDVVFGVYIVQHIPHASVVSLGTGAAIYTLGILLSEPLLASYYDKDLNGKTAFYGYVFGNFLKTVLRLCFVLISSIKGFYIIYFLLGITHSVGYPSFSKIFTQNIERGGESKAWGYKDFLFSIGSILALFSSGYIALYFGYNTLFMASSLVLLLAGVIFPLINKGAFLISSK